ncbi:hypothetical protein K438DRAFT_1986003 [Mycena galopus ATCC 62051]|nr:hypothetical protein K438DRAFT_1986003 [Mycena galopus ATCC 62051]
MDQSSAAQVIEPEIEPENERDVLVSPSLPARAPRTHLPARPPVPPSPATSEAIVVLTNARLARTLASPTCTTLVPAPMMRSVSSLPMPMRTPLTPPPMPHSPSSPKPREDDPRPSKACPRAAFLHDTHAVRFCTKLGREGRVQVLACTGHSQFPHHSRPCTRHLRHPHAARPASSLKPPRRLLYPTSIFAVRLRSSVLGGHETHPHSLPPLISAAPNKSLAPTADDSACDNDELTVTADDDRVGGSIDPPSLRAHCEPPLLCVSCEALPPLRVNCDTPAGYTNDSADADGAEQRTPGTMMSSKRQRRCPGGREAETVTHAHYSLLPLPDPFGALAPSVSRSVFSSPRLNSFTNCVNLPKSPHTPIMTILSHFPAVHPSLLAAIS